MVNARAFSLWAPMKYCSAGMTSPELVKSSSAVKIYVALPVGVDAHALTQRPRTFLPRGLLRSGQV